MLTLALIAALAAPVAAHAVDTPAASEFRRACNDPTGVFFTHGTTAHAQQLGEQPPAKHILTLWRQVDRCPSPVVLREGIGVDPARGR